MVQLHELVRVKAGSLDHLYLADVDILEGIDGGSALLDQTADGVGNKLSDEALQGALVDLLLDNGSHALADAVNLRGLSIGGLAALVGALAGEADHEDTEEIAISGLDVDVGLNQALPLTDERAQLVGGEAQTVEVGEERLALDVLDLELDVAVSLIFIILQVGEVDLNHTALETIGSVAGTLAASHRGTANVTLAEDVGGLDQIPVLLGERVDLALLALAALTLLTT